LHDMLADILQGCFVNCAWKMRINVIPFVLAALVAFSPACRAQVAVPQSAAGEVLKEWLSAFNSADRAAISDYLKKFDPSETADGVLSLRSQTGPFDLAAIERSEPLRISFRVKQQKGGGLGFGSIRLKESEPHVIDAFTLIPIPADAIIDETPLNDESRQAAIQSINSSIEEFYVYADLAKRMSAALLEHQSHGDYRLLVDGDVFAKQLTQDMRAVSHDKHLVVAYRPYRRPDKATQTVSRESIEDSALKRRDLERDNCGFRKIEILPGNLGYLKFDVFDDPALCGDTAIAAMQFLAHTDGVIFDLRENHGGDPKMVALILSYLFDKPTHLNDLYRRKEDSTTQFWTLPYVPGERLAETPVFVLTSKETFSAAEEFSYDLKSLKRAKIVGETTGGGAHPVDIHQASEHFTVRVPVARAINPETKTDWEGVGVQPDVAVSPPDALGAAVGLALKEIKH
jgi:hypothetical protein